MDRKGICGIQNLFWNMIFSKLIFFQRNTKVKALDSKNQNLLPPNFLHYFIWDHYSMTKKKTFKIFEILKVFILILKNPLSSKHKIYPFCWLFRKRIRGL